MGRGEELRAGAEGSTLRRRAAALWVQSAPGLSARLWQHRERDRDWDGDRRLRAHLCLCLSLRGQPHLRPGIGSGNFPRAPS